MAQVLIIEDEELTVRFLRLMLEGLGYEVLVATNFQEFKNLLPSLTLPLVALVDEKFPGGRGKEVAQILEEQFPEAKLISISGDETVPWKPLRHIRKPWLPSISVLLDAVEELFEE